MHVYGAFGRLKPRSTAWEPVLAARTRPLEDVRLSGGQGCDLTVGPQVVPQIVRREELLAVPRHPFPAEGELDGLAPLLGIGDFRPLERAVPFLARLEPQLPFGRGGRGVRAAVDRSSPRRTLQPGRSRVEPAPRPDRRPAVAVLGAGIALAALVASAVRPGLRTQPGRHRASSRTRRRRPSPRLWHSRLSRTLRRARLRRTSRCRMRRPNRWQRLFRNRGVRPQRQRRGPLHPRPSSRHPGPRPRRPSPRPRPRRAPWRRGAATRPIPGCASRRAVRAETWTAVRSVTAGFGSGHRTRTISTPTRTASAANADGPGARTPSVRAPSGSSRPGCRRA